MSGFRRPRPIGGGAPKADAGTSLSLPAMSSARRMVASNPVYPNLRLRGSKNHQNSKTKFSRAR